MMNTHVHFCKIQIIPMLIFEMLSGKIIVVYFISPALLLIHFITLHTHTRKYDP